MYRDIPPRLRELVEPIVVGHGLELVDAEILSGPGGPVVRVVVDTPAGDGRVAIERCADVSREIGTGLDAAADFARGFRLEVASPGLDRLLAREKDFVAACGAEVKIETRRPLDGRRHFRGELVAFAEGVARVRVDGADHIVPFDEVARARRVYHFTPADFSKPSRMARRAGGAS
jgi:ribosome maturation factor RimP